MSDEQSQPELYKASQNISQPAFPCDVTGGFKGLSMRDYFAAHAPEVPSGHSFPIKQWTVEEIVDLGGGMKGPRKVQYQESWSEHRARWAIEYADAMLAERAK